MNAIDRYVRADDGENLPRLSYSVREAVVVTGASRRFINKLLRAGALKSALVGRRRFIDADSLIRTFTKSSPAK